MIHKLMKKIPILLVVAVLLANTGFGSADWFSKDKWPCSVGDTVEFGQYEQDCDPENGSEEIEWLVLSVKSGKALLISKYALEMVPFNKTWEECSWEISSIRAGLNGSFFLSAFDANERSMIVETDTTDVKGHETLDKVFLLSCKEAEKYFSDDNERICSGTAACKAEDGYIGDGNVSWWLRTMYRDNVSADIVNGNGVVDERIYFNLVEDECTAVRPAIWLDLNRFYSETADNTEPEDDTNNNFLEAVTEGQTVSFGRYEQDGNLEDGLEPIEWLVLESENGKALLLSKSALAASPYEEGEAEAIWEKCSLRVWLNSDFLYSAFNENERKTISPAVLSDSTVDSVSLLTVDEAAKYLKSSELICEPAERLIINGTYGGNGYCEWWLRDTYSAENCPPMVSDSGEIVEYQLARLENIFVRPTIWIFTSDIVTK